MAVWRQHPTEIERELHDAGRSIREWHRGVMSSRELLVLLRHAPEDGPYKTVLRDGDWPDWVQMIKEIHKEISVYRASKYVGTDYEYVPMVFMSAPERSARLAQERVESEFQENAFDEFTCTVFDDVDSGAEVDGSEVGGLWR